MSEEQSEPLAGEEAGVTMVDVLALPDELRTIVIWLMRQGEAGLPELAAHVEQDEASAHPGSQFGRARLCAGEAQ